MDDISVIAAAEEFLQAEYLRGYEDAIDDMVRLLEEEGMDKEEVIKEVKKDRSDRYEYL